MSEASALRLRSKSQAIGGVSQQAASVLFKFTLPFIFNPDAGNLRAKTGFVYTGLCLIGGFGTFFWVPEMKGRNALEIDDMFELKLPARQFKHWRSERGEHVETKEE
jgi:MFS transporter, SP family, general alpha glucoside:H+ symporter